MEEMLKQLLKEFSEMRSEMRDMKSDIQDIKAKTDDIPLIKQAVLETNQRTDVIESYTKSLLTSQAKQDKLLETLAIRSLEQETDIREIKRVK